jgi:transposase InsO family protein
VGAARRAGPKGGARNASRTAEQPGQTLNVDLCFVPARHAVADQLPAVSGSSGRLVVARPAPQASERCWPGQVFADPARDYAEAMHAFVAASATRPAAPPAGDCGAASDARAARRARRREEAALRGQRRQVRARRRQEDAAWRALRAQRRASPPPATAAARAAAAAQWRALRAARRAAQARRHREDATWRQRRRQLRERRAGQPPVTAWLAVLVVTDNCTRQCLGLPLFAAGAHVTAEAIAAALRALLPAELQFLISDRGTHFTAQVFRQLAQERGFVHVVIARHRPESNGIAERCVRTLKAWLAAQPWEDAPALAALLARFRDEYTDRPHQGLPLPGLSPNEFANRLWLL